MVRCFCMARIVASARHPVRVAASPRSRGKRPPPTFVCLVTHQILVPALSVPLR